MGIQASSERTTPARFAPCLWFDFNAEEAVQHYLGIFERSRILQVLHYGDEMPEREGRVLMIQFELQGQRFQALNGGPQFPFTEAISLSVECEDQAEVDRLWEQLSKGGSKGDCGWLKDRFGLSWQIVPRGFMDLLGDPDAGRASRAMKAMLTMSRLDIARLRASADGTDSA